MTTTRPLRQITRKEWEAIPSAYKGEWTQGIADFRGDIPPELIGKKTMMDYEPENGGTVLLTEGIHFNIAP